MDPCHEHDEHVHFLGFVGSEEWECVKKEVMFAKRANATAPENFVKMREKSCVISGCSRGYLRVQIRLPVGAKQFVAHVFTVSCTWSWKITNVDG